MAISKGNLWSFSPKDEFPYSYQIVLMPIALFIDVILLNSDEMSVQKSLVLQPSNMSNENRASL